MDFEKDINVMVLKIYEDLNRIRESQARYEIIQSAIGKDVLIMKHELMDNGKKGLLTRFAYVERLAYFSIGGLSIITIKGALDVMIGFLK